MIELRPISWNDVPAILPMLSAGPEISERTATIPYPYTEEHARDFVSRVLASGERVFVILDKGVVVGTIGIIGHGEETEIGYWIGKQHWGRGYATAAVAAVIDFCRTQEMRSLRAEVFPDNPASAWVLEKERLPVHRRVRARSSAARRDAKAPALQAGDVTTAACAFGAYSLRTRNT